MAKIEGIIWRKERINKSWLSQRDTALVNKLSASDDLRILFHSLLYGVGRSFYGYALGLALTGLRIFFCGIMPLQ